jgi:16S rRNA (uracil1498-N3)-methyltransferase
VSLPVFLAEPGALAHLGVGNRYVLDGPEARHAASVRRIRVGESIEVVDGAGTALRGVVEAVEAESVTLRVSECSFEDLPDVALVLVQALAKGDRDERAIEAATEIGVDAVVPWQAERSVSVWSGPRADRGEKRWAAVAAAAAKQSRRARVPEVRTLARGDALVGIVASAVGAGSVAVVLHESATTPLAAVALPTAGEVLVVVGPEGGLSAAEVAALESAGAAVARLGPHVLRTSTAGPVAIALLAERLGRWVLPAAAR